jgi:hypothetical protein
LEDGALGATVNEAGNLWEILEGQQKKKEDQIVRRRRTNWWWWCLVWFVGFFTFAFAPLLFGFLAILFSAPKQKILHPKRMDGWMAIRQIGKEANSKSGKSGGKAEEEEATMAAAEMP